MHMATSKLETIDHDDEYFNDNESWEYSTTVVRRAWFAGGCTTLLITLLKSISLITSTGSLSSWLHLLFATVIGYLAADLGSGVYHWAIDNYGSPQTLIFGSQIEPFQSHHQRPTAITKHHISYTLYIPSATTTLVVMPINLLSNDPVLLGFVAALAGFAMFSQRFHVWAHTPKGKLSPLVVALQDAGLLVGRSHHAVHHRPPYDMSYCIVSGVWNRFLDWSRLFVGLEVLIFKMFGVQPRSWN